MVQSIYIYNKIKASTQKLVSTRLNSENTNVQMMSIPSRPTNNVIIDLDTERGRGTVATSKFGPGGGSSNNSKTQTQDDW